MIESELTPISITLTKIKNRPHTILANFKLSNDPMVSNEKELLRKLKTKICSTGGHLKKDDHNDTLYVLQGNKKDELNTYLKTLGIKKSMIINTGVA